MKGLRLSVWVVFALVAGLLMVPGQAARKGYHYRVQRDRGSTRGAGSRDVALPGEQYACQGDGESV